MIYDRVLEEEKFIESQISKNASILKDLPQGNLLCVRNGNYFKWYNYKDGEKIYIPKKQKQYAQQLALRKFLTLQQEDFSHESIALNFYKRHHTPFPGRAEKLFLKNSGYQELLSPFFQPLSQELSQWMNSPYEKSTKYPEQLTHKINDHTYVRSKSEAIIALMLHMNKIPFRYECALHLDQNVFYPDFTIKHPKTGATYYWEHFGMMDDPTYYRSAYNKMQFFNSYGIVPSIQLIITFETQKHPLSTELVRKIIEYYF